jgi:hypothetical protein
MFTTAQGIVGRYGGEPMLAGPGCADVTDTNRLRTGYASLAVRLLAGLAGAGFVPGPRFAWTHHNYSDVTFDLGPGSTAPDDRRRSDPPGQPCGRHARAARRLLGRVAVGQRGRPGAAHHGGRRHAGNVALRWGIDDPGVQRAKQAELLQRNWSRMSAGAQAAGVGMVANYLWYTDLNFDSGLCDADGTTRAAYGAWSALPSYG